MANIYHPFLDFSVPSKELGTDPGDVILSDGIILDIKQTKYDFGKLFIEVKQAPSYIKSPIDGFVLVTGSISEEFGKYCLRGFISKDSLIQDYRKGYLNNTYDYIANQSALVSYDKINEVILIPLVA